MSVWDIVHHPGAKWGHPGTMEANPRVMIARLVAGDVGNPGAREVNLVPVRSSWKYEGHPLALEAILNSLGHSRALPGVLQFIET